MLTWKISATIKSCETSNEDSITQERERAVASLDVYRATRNNFLSRNSLKCPERPDRRSERKKEEKKRKKRKKKKRGFSIAGLGISPREKSDNSTAALLLQMPANCN